MRPTFYCLRHGAVLVAVVFFFFFCSCCSTWGRPSVAGIWNASNFEREREKKENKRTDRQTEREPPRCGKCSAFFFFKVSINGLQQRIELSPFSLLLFLYSHLNSDKKKHRVLPAFVRSFFRHQRSTYNCKQLEISGYISVCANEVDYFSLSRKQQTRTVEHRKLTGPR